MYRPYFAVLCAAAYAIFAGALSANAQGLPPQSDSWFKTTQFLACTGNPYALCYYSGPNTPTPRRSGQDVPTMPCIVGSGAEKSADCTCYAITEADPSGPQYNYVLITSILNNQVREETEAQCGQNGELCLNIKNLPQCLSGSKEEFCKTAPVCDTLGSIENGQSQTLYPKLPNVDLISTFSFKFAEDHPLNSTTCDPAPYAACMTAPCTTGEDGLTTCKCPVYDGDYQVGMNLDRFSNLGCNIEPNVWSAANKLDLHISQD